MQRTLTNKRPRRWRRFFIALVAASTVAVVAIWLLPWLLTPEDGQSQDWPRKADAMDWNDRLNVAVITVPEVISGERDVLLVMHDAGHGGWQFYDGHDIRGRKPKAIKRDDILKIDATLGEITDLPVGWLARRAAKGQPWVRKPLQLDSDGRLIKE